MALTANLSLGLNIEFSKSLDLSTPKDTLSQNRGKTLNNGTGADQADTVWHDKRTLGDGENETLDFHDGSLSDPLGGALTLDELKALYIKNYSSDAGLKIGGAAANALGLFADATDILLLPPGGELLFTAPGSGGIDITTNSDLKLEHDGTGSSSLIYDIVVIGVD
ncbi:MAG: hypothetical protein AMJ84_05420 [Acidithiobacillales bacterium SM23_46]|nr:MAG: hypothetical protein AMJ84_05420 [Acidithiobacillales bacterium SM23_46]KPL27974.1 MAG: hypothetical protein AMJ72_05935 [Acidithiobacillales bacterium SM1_46]